jgi:hypothetical protein
MTNAARTILLLVFVSLLGTAVLFAQSDLGTISGYVKDPSGASVSGAKVTVHNQTGVERQTVTNEAGFYTITNVPPGLYSVQAEAAGFQKYQSNDNKLDPAGHLSVDASLAVGASSQTVQVTASAATLQTESATTKS